MPPSAFEGVLKNALRSFKGILQNASERSLGILKMPLSLIFKGVLKNAIKDLLRLCFQQHFQKCFK